MDVVLMVEKFLASMVPSLPATLVVARLDAASLKLGSLLELDLGARTDPRCDEEDGDPPPPTAPSWRPPGSGGGCWWLEEEG